MIRPRLSGWQTALILGIAILVGGCHSARIKFPRQGTDGPQFEVEFDDNTSKTRQHIIKECHSWLGTPYKHAGIDKDSGVDCSGLVMQVYLKVADIKLPRNSAKQSEFCKHIKKKNVRPGDLVFFATGNDPDKVTHVGIMIDEDKFIHSSSSKGVCIASVSSPWYSKRVLHYGRVPHMT
ncbi:MAG: C40 family peptidase [Muribaculaceae bacterium]|nr:C40 family peptidase [Muribaculaceae bacterium]